MSIRHLEIKGGSTSHSRSCGANLKLDNLVKVGPKLKIGKFLFNFLLKKKKVYILYFIEKKKEKEMNERKRKESLKVTDFWVKQAMWCSHFTYHHQLSKKWSEKKDRQGLAIDFQPPISISALDPTLIVSRPLLQFLAFFFSFFNFLLITFMSLLKFLLCSLRRTKSPSVWYI